MWGCGIVRMIGADLRVPHDGERRAAGLVVRGLVGWKAKWAGVFSRLAVEKGGGDPADLASEDSAQAGLWVSSYFPISFILI
jgi:hypothetical protein